MPFVEAAEAGTKKVITDHSTVGIVVTTDGSVTELDRENYLEAEARVIKELQAMGKPFVVLLNTAMPYGEEARSLREEMEEQYGVPVLAVNVAQLKAEDIRNILEKILYRFPLKELRFYCPGWVETCLLYTSSMKNFVFLFKQKRWSEKQLPLKKTLSFAFLIS